MKTEYRIVLLSNGKYKVQENRGFVSFYAWQDPYPFNRDYIYDSIDEARAALNMLKPKIVHIVKVIE